MHFIWGDLTVDGPTVVLSSVWIKAASSLIHNLVSQKGRDGGRLLLMFCDKQLLPCAMLSERLESRLAITWVKVRIGAASQMAAVLWPTPSFCGVVMLYYFYSVSYYYFVMHLTNDAS